MKIFEILVPGIWIDLEDKDVAFRLQNYINGIHSKFNEAVMLLSLFEQSQATAKSQFDESSTADPVREVDNTASSDADDLATRMIESPEKSDEIFRNWSMEQIAKRRKHWESGAVPLEYSRSLPFAYARAFLYSVWTIGKLFDQVSTCDGLPENVLPVAKNFHSALPSLKGLRDSSAHIDERLDGRARGKKIRTKSINNRLAQIPEGSFVFSENLFGNKFIGTVATGELAELAITGETLVHVQRCFQDLLDSFSWTGVGRLHPES